MSDSLYGASCPRCQFEISQDRMHVSPIVCDHCGWSSMKTQNKQEKQTTRTFQRIAIAGGIIMMAAFIHVVNWDSHFFTIIPLKTAQMMGNADRSTLLQIADICTERMKYACTEEAYETVVTKNPADIQTLEKLAKLQLLMKQNDKSLRSYKQYFEQGGREAEPAYQYARLLEAAGMTNEAEQYYSYAIEQKPDTLQVAVSEAYVRLLMKTSRYKEAKNHIDHLRKRGVPKYFLSTEYDKISNVLKRHS